MLAARGLGLTIFSHSIRRIDMQRRTVHTRPAWADHPGAIAAGLIFFALLIAAIAMSGRFG
jgi:hypothetical protein